MSEPARSKPKLAEPDSTAAAPYTLDAPVGPTPAGISKPAAWALFRWYIAMYLVMIWLIHGFGSLAMQTALKSMNVPLPLPTNLALFLLGNPIGLLITCVGIPVGWGLLIRYLPNDRGRLRTCIFFCCLLLLMTMGLVMAIMLAIFKMQEALQSTP